MTLIWRIPGQSHKSAVSSSPESLVVSIIKNRCGLRIDSLTVIRGGEAADHDLQ